MRCWWYSGERSCFPIFFSDHIFFFDVIVQVHDFGNHLHIICISLAPTLPPSQYFPLQKFLVTKVPEIAFSFLSVLFSQVFPYITGELSLSAEFPFKMTFTVNEQRQGVMTPGEVSADINI